MGRLCVCAGVCVRSDQYQVHSIIISVHCVCVQSFELSYVCSCGVNSSPTTPPNGE